MAEPITRRSLTHGRALIVLAVVTALVGLAGLSPAAATPASAHATALVPARTMRIAVVLLRLPGSNAEPVSRATMQSTMFGATKSVANWFAQTSGGQVKVTGAVYGYFGGVRSCDLATELAAGAAAAAQSGYVAANYDNLVVYTPSQSCGFSGMGWIGASGAFLSGDASQGVIEHELGHNLGLMHAGAYACGAAAPTGSCLLDYGDPTDVMGDQTLNHGLSAEHKYMLGWIPASEVRTVTAGTQTIALTASENPLVAGSTELIHVRAADGTLFAVDRRASLGYDAGYRGCVGPPGGTGELRRHRAAHEQRGSRRPHLHQQCAPDHGRDVGRQWGDRDGSSVRRPVPRRRSPARRRLRPARSPRATSWQGAEPLRRTRASR